MRRAAVVSFVLVAIAIGCGLDVTGIAPAVQDGDAEAPGPGAGTSTSTTSSSGTSGASSSTSSSSASSTSSAGGVKDAGTDTGGGSQACPAQCTSCSGTTCVKDCGAGGDCTTKTFTCPAGRDCKILCPAGRCMTSTFYCAPGKRCSLSCTGKNACSVITVNGNGASSLCVDCTHDQGGVGNEACNQILCAAQPAQCRSTGEPSCGVMCNDALDCAF